MDTTPNLGLPYIAAAQAQKHVTHNEALRALDIVVQLSVADRDRTVPPDAPTEGVRYIVGAGAADAWVGRDHNVAAYQDGAWAFFDPQRGWLAWVEDEGRAVVWDGAQWSDFGGGSGISVNPTPLVGINATADSVNRLSVNAPASLFNHEGQGHQLKLNKATAGDTASVLYQTGFSGRAEFGLTGDDDFHVKVSPDGSTWHEALIINGNTGAVSFPNTSGSAASASIAATFALTLAGTATGTYVGATAVEVGYAAYTRMGELCSCRCAFRLSGVTDSELAAGSILELAGLPFPVDDTAGGAAQAISGIAARAVGGVDNTQLGGFAMSENRLQIVAFAAPSNNARNSDWHYLNFTYALRP